MHKKITNQPFEDAFLIAKKPYLEKKIISTLLTKNHGIIHAITYQSKQKKQNLELFNLLACQLLVKTSMSQLKTIEVQKPYPPLQGQYVFAGLYINELIYKLFQPNEPQKKLFSLYQNTLENLIHQKSIQQTIRLFEHILQQLLGYGLNTQVLEEYDNDWFRFHPEMGLTPCLNNTSEAIHRTTLQQLANTNFTKPQTQQTSKAIFAQILKHILGEKKIFITQMMPKE